MSNGARSADFYETQRRQHSLPVSNGARSADFYETQRRQHSLPVSNGAHSADFYETQRRQHSLPVSNDETQRRRDCPKNRQPKTIGARDGFRATSAQVASNRSKMGGHVLMTGKRSAPPVLDRLDVTGADKN